mmetsp:Transcript_31573/g.75399  ORF Transcript_31573/g.75399 Transcript_31573/m.75399 type:complete len:83 (-) Transcript_31573:45-293(-)
MVWLRILGSICPWGRRRPNGKGESRSRDATTNSQRAERRTCCCSQIRMKVKERVSVAAFCPGFSCGMDHRLGTKPLRNGSAE